MNGPTAIWVLGHPCVVSLNETNMLAAAAAIPRGQLRSGRVRPGLSSRPPPPPLAPPPPPLALPPPPPPPPPPPQSSLFVDKDDDDNDDNAVVSLGGPPSSPSPPPRTPSPAPAPGLGPRTPSAAPPSIGTFPGSLSQAEYDRSQVADQARLPWGWSPWGKTSEPYTPTVSGKWWSRTTEELGTVTPSKRNDISHIGRIMETELGVQLFGKERCEACQHGNQECWVYTNKAGTQVKYTGDACARCRLTARAGGCSLSKRKRKRDPSPPDRRPPRPLFPRDGPPPGAGGSAIKV